MKVAGEIDAVGAATEDKHDNHTYLFLHLKLLGTDRRDYFWFITISEKQDLIIIR